MRDVSRTGLVISPSPNRRHLPTLLLSNLLLLTSIFVTPLTDLLTVSPRVLGSRPDIPRCNRSNPALSLPSGPALKNPLKEEGKPRVARYDRNNALVPAILKSLH